MHINISRVQAFCFAFQNVNSIYAYISRVRLPYFRVRLRLVRFSSLQSF